LTPQRARDSIFTAFTSSCFTTLTIFTAFLEPKKPFGITAYPVPCALNPDPDRPQAAASGVNRIVESNDAGVQINVVF
jgi:hypothetical protein